MGSLAQATKQDIITSILFNRIRTLRATSLDIQSCMGQTTFINSTWETTNQLILDTWLEEASTTSTWCKAQIPLWMPAWTQLAQARHQVAPATILQVLKEEFTRPSNSTRRSSVLANVMPERKAMILIIKSCNCHQW